MATAVLEESLAQRVLSGDRISRADAAALYNLPLNELGALADHRRKLIRREAFAGRGNEIVTYIVDRNINYTNVCNVYCKFCAFYRTERDTDHYVLNHEQLDAKLDELTAIGGVQILLQGGHHPKLGIDYYLNLLSHVREKYPHINVHGFSPPEFNHFADVFGLSLREVITRFKEAGLGSIPGSIAAAFLLGYAETCVAYLISSSWTEIVSVLATLLMLVFRPAGIFGKRAAF